MYFLNIKNEKKIDYKTTYPFDERKSEATRVLNKYPERIPIICQKVDNNDDSIPTIEKIKYLVPIDLTLAQFMCILRKKLDLPSEKAVFIFVNDTIPTASETIQKIYEEHKDLDGFLYMTYSGENTFG
tara:strand:+ start:660 stop:1043 length:384 start_codon:yes stop_codon:yes gene_type:complete